MNAIYMTDPLIYTDVTNFEDPKTKGIMFKNQTSQTVLSHHILLYNQHDISMKDINKVQIKFDIADLIFKSTYLKDLAPK